MRTRDMAHFQRAWIAGPLPPHRIVIRELWAPSNFLWEGRRVQNCA